MIIHEVHLEGNKWYTINTGISVLWLQFSLSGKYPLPHMPHVWRLGAEVKDEPYGWANQLRILYT